MDVQKIIPKVIEDRRAPLKTGETEGQVHMGTVTPIGEDTLKKANNPVGEVPVEAPKAKTETKELSLDDLGQWLLAGINKDNQYIYQLKKGMTVNDLLGLMNWLRMKIESDIAIHQKMNAGVFTDSLDYLVKVQEQYNKITATRLAEVTLALQTQTSTLQNFVNALQEGKVESEAVSKKKSRKK